MNPYCQSTLHHIQFAVQTILAIMDKLQEEDLAIRPTLGKFSIGELLEHTAMICQADSHISEGASSEEMDAFYARTSYRTIDEIRTAIVINYESLKQKYMELTEDELLTEVTSHWGVTYTRYGWLQEMMAHMYHHRGQLHAMLVHCSRKDPGIFLFE